MNSSAARETGDAETVVGRVCRVDSSGCEVALEDGARVFARVRGRVHRIGGRERSPLAAGDRVQLGRRDDGDVVEKVLPRRSRFSRESAIGGKPQILAANVDVVLALLPVADPPPNPRFADRVLVAAEDESVESVVILSKTDLAEKAVTEDLRSLYENAGFQVVATSVPDGVGLEEVADLLRGRTSVLVGTSGAGKTTLLGALLGPDAEPMRTGEVNPKTGKGRHTTTAASLLPFPGGGWVVDTPGVRTLAVRIMRPANLALLFGDLGRVGPCRFADCSHTVEPDCAVAAAAEDGRIDPRRFESYHHMVDTMKEDAERRGIPLQDGP
ncbi:MAG: ribosome small subunit-dependent GTPase A [Planctomycetota bacterium]